MTKYEWNQPQRRFLYNNEYSSYDGDSYSIYNSYSRYGSYNNTNYNTDYNTNYTSGNSTDWWSSFFNQTSFNHDVNELNSNLHPASDVDINGVITSAIFNFIVFVVFMLSYEILRRCFPNVYASKQSREARLERARLRREEEERSEQWNGVDMNGSGATGEGTAISRHAEKQMSEGQTILNEMKLPRQYISKKRSLPDVYKSEIPFQWVNPVYNISWRKVRETSGLDAYFFLRYIRMCLRITAVSAFWGMLILFPVYAYGDNGASGWYHFSMANISQGSHIIWVSIFFIYFFSFYVLFVIKQEYKHFVQLRLDFLGKGDGSTDPQHHYSLMVENIPKELRSDSALFTYFNQLFPGKVHSANIILRLPELERLSQRKLRIMRRLEKSIAYYEATGTRPTHINGRYRPMICGVESTPVEWCCDSDKVVDIQDEDVRFGHAKRGIRVDSIEYYTKDLHCMNVELFQLQMKKKQIAAFGNRSVNGTGWFSVLSEYADMFFNDELSSDEEDEDQFSDDDSSIDNLEECQTPNRLARGKIIARDKLIRIEYELIFCKIETVENM